MYLCLKSKIFGDILSSFTDIFKDQNAGVILSLTIFHYFFQSQSLYLNFLLVKSLIVL